MKYTPLRVYLKAKFKKKSNHIKLGRTFVNKYPFKSLTYIGIPNIKTVKNLDIAFKTTLWAVLLGVVKKYQVI